MTKNHLNILSVSKYVQSVLKYFIAIKTAFLKLLENLDFKYLFFVTLAVQEASKTSLNSDQVRKKRL